MAVAMRAHAPIQAAIGFDTGFLSSVAMHNIMVMSVIVSAIVPVIVPVIGL